MIAVVMGVSGSGKSTIGRALAERLGFGFLDADDLHPEANRRKMAAGTPLHDTDRAPWLDLLADRIAKADAAGEDLIVACSALRRAYRERLRRAAPLRFVHLACTAETLEKRLIDRRRHFMPAGLLASQLALLEPPQTGPRTLTLDSGRPVPELVEAAAAWIAS